MKYAVFDWDNTVRNGFTLFSWMDFLFDNGILQKSVQKNIKKVQLQYAKGIINHDQYAERACKIYALSMKGFSDEKKISLVKQYIRYDKKNLYPFSENMFDCLRRYNIKPVVITGAPFYIIKEYRDSFGLYDIYAFCEESLNGFCTGRVSYNYGTNKKKTVEKLCAKFGERPLIGFGDSDSDIPLFDIAQNAFCVVGGNQNEKKYGKNIVYVSNETNGKQISILLHEIVFKNDRKI